MKRARYLSIKSGFIAPFHARIFTPGQGSQEMEPRIEEEEVESVPAQTCHLADDYQGWGTLNLNWLFGPQRYYFVDQTAPLGQGQYLDTILTIVDGSQQTRITLVWTDPPSMPVSIPYTIVNNLDVAASAVPVQCIVQNPCWFGNNWNTATGDTLPSPPADGYSDGINNVEEIFIPANWYPSGTQLLVRVVAQVVAQGANQDYALVISNIQ